LRMRNGEKTMKARHFLILAPAMILLMPRASQGEISIGYAMDVIHALGTDAIVTRYDHRESRLGLQAMYWNGPDHSNGSLGVDYDLIPSETWDLNLGGAYLARVNTVNGTHFNFSAGLGINIGSRFRVQFTHMSNAHSNNNNGWNFVGFLLRF